MAASPVRVAVTGAAGAISYSLLFRIAAGEVFGEDTPVELRLVEIPDAMGALEGVAMELDDSAFPLVTSLDLADNPEEGFDGISAAFLVGSRPRTKGMERADLLEVNGKIFTGQGKALNDHAGDDLKVLVVGNPANTNALIAMNNAPDIPDERFTAMTRLDHNRALAQISKKTGTPVREISNMTVWGNHSPSMYPDIYNAKIGGKPGGEVITDESWLADEFIPTVGKRGAAIIEARGSSSAASAASAAVDHFNDWVHGTADGDWVSMAVPSDGSYGVDEGIISSFACTTSGGEWSIVEGLDVNDFSRGFIDKTVAELKEERDTVKSQGMF
ncbi:MAG: malate dehydrogenase [Thermoleophilaceae bacterium]|nr:malate dehydrogenase [Thermoleophilaceae bacterium]